MHAYCILILGLPITDMVRKPPIPLNFIHHEQLECDHNGCNYTIEGHDITVRIPEGAVAEGEKIHFEVGVAMYGPFIFPDNTQPISPILWLRQLEGGTQLKRCYQLVLPHCYKGLASIIYHGPGHNKIFFATSDHSSSRHISTDGNVELLYSLIEWENDIDFDIDDNYGTFESYICNHIFCIVKRSHTQSYEWYRDVGFSLVRVDLQPSQTVQEFHFYGLFDLATHKKVYIVALCLVYSISAIPQLLELMHACRLWKTNLRRKVRQYPLQLHSSLK